MRRNLYLTLAMLLATASLATAQTVFVVRHAERADTATGGSMSMTDPDLSELGTARAQALARVLRDVGITAIYVTEFKRTQQTAEPLAKALGIQWSLVSAKDMPGLIGKLKTATANTLIIGHSNTVPEILKQLGVVDPVTLASADYDNLFVVSRGEKPTFVRLHFGKQP
ncbi:MAG TPA: histidine phosphatase family protein [Vicinamibacterales bacterium]|nr:histidine phosphatase family protein [Vicinamibacterales bacterium]